MAAVGAVGAAAADNTALAALPDSEYVGHFLFFFFKKKIEGGGWKIRGWGGS